MKKSLLRNPVLQVLCAIACGILLGYADPALAVQMKPLGDGFISVIKLTVGPIVFLSVASGIAAMSNIKQLGRVGITAIIYFEVLSALALIAGLTAAHLLQPGDGFKLDLYASTASVAAHHASQAPIRSLPQILVDVFTNSAILQVLVLAILSGMALAGLGERGKRISASCDHIAGWLFKIVNLLLKVAPFAVFGAIAYTVGKYGLVSVEPLLNLLGALYLTSILFVLIIHGTIARLFGFSILRFISYIKEELILVFGTSSSVAAMPKLIEKLERAGCAKSVVTVVVPAGYSFNLNGTNIYLMLALAFLAQALDVELDFAQCLTIFTVAMVTSKSASGVAGAAFIALAATLAAVPAISDSALVFIFGIERLLKCRSLTNIVGNGVACMAISSLVRELDHRKLNATDLA